MENNSALAKFMSIQKEHKMVSVIIWIAATVVSGIVMFPSRASELLPMIAMTGALGCIAIYLLARYNTILTERINSTAYPEWHVQINGVDVGTISDNTYAEIRRTVFFDPRIYISQIINIGVILTRVVDYLFVSIPLAIFWLAAIIFFVFPVTFTDITTSLQNATPVGVSAALNVFMSLFGTLSILAIGVKFALGRSFGFVNHFSVACGNLLIREINCPVEGRIDLYRIIDGKNIQQSEIDFMRKH